MQIGVTEIKNTILVKKQTEIMMMDSWSENTFQSAKEIKVMASL